MQRSMLSLAAIGCILALPGFTAPAHAAFTTFVSQTGNNANACTSPAAPCQTLAGALAKTDSGGVMHVAPGEYAALLINKSVEIVADGGNVSVANSTINAGPGSSAVIVVDVAGLDDVRIRGFTLDRHGAPGSGIAFIGLGTLYVENCTLVNNTGSDSGIAFVPDGPSELYVSDSFISGGSGSPNGVLIRPANGGAVTAVFDNTRFENDVFGITIDGRDTFNSNTITIRDTVISGNSSYAIGAIDGGSGETNVVVEGSTFARNGTFGVLANGANVTIRVHNSTITNNGTGVSALNGATLISNGGNVVRGNTANGAFTATEAQQ